MLALSGNGEYNIKKEETRVCEIDDSTKFSVLTRFGLWYIRNKICCAKFLIFFSFNYIYLHQHLFIYVYTLTYI